MRKAANRMNFDFNVAEDEYIDGDEVRACQIPCLPNPEQFINTACCRSCGCFALPVCIWVWRAAGCFGM